MHELRWLSGSFLNNYFRQHLSSFLFQFYRLRNISESKSKKFYWLFHLDDCILLLATGNRTIPGRKPMPATSKPKCRGPMPRACDSCHKKKVRSCSYTSIERLILIFLVLSTYLFDLSILRDHENDNNLKIHCDRRLPKCDWCLHHDLSCTFNRIQTNTRKKRWAYILYSLLMSIIHLK